MRTVGGPIKDSGCEGEEPKASRYGSPVPTKRNGASFPFLVFLFFVGGMFPDARVLYGQDATSGELRGRILDETGAPIPSAMLRFVDPETHTVTTRVGSADGSYFYLSVKPAKLDIIVSASGFAQAKVDGVVVLVGHTTFQNVTLKPAVISETIRVSGAVPLVQSTRSEIGEVIDRKSIDSLPLKDRNLAALAVTTPQIVPAPAVDPTKVKVSNISSAGTSGRQSNVFVDGFEDYDPLVGGLAYDLGVDAIQEFNVVSTRFTAEQGRSAGAIVNVVQRSGTNDAHGSAFLFYRNQSLAAKDFFQINHISFHNQQSGFSLGGPFVQRKLFGFLSFEDRRGLSPADINTHGTFPQFDRTVAMPFRQDLVTFRTDYEANDKQRIFARLNLDNLAGLEGIGGSADVSAGTHNATTNISVAASQNYLISQNFLNSLGIQYTSFSNLLNRLSNMPGEIRPDLVTGVQTVTQQSNLDRRLQFKDDLNAVVGKHSLKFGIEFQHLYFSGAWDFAKRGIFGFFNDAPLDATNADILMMNQCDTPNCDTGVITSNLYSAYLHDDWRLTKKLTLNMGLRWDYYTNETGKQFKGIAGLLVPPSRGTNPWNIAPRIGLAFDPLGKGNLVLRGGYGVYFQNLALTDIAVEQAFGSQAIAYKTFLDPGNISVSNPFPGMTSAQVKALFFSPPYSTFILLKNGLQTPYYQYTSGGLQWGFSSDFVLSIDGVHMLGVKGMITRDINVDPSFAIAAPQSPLCEQFGNSVCKQFGALPYEDNGNTSHYNALVVSLKKRFSKRIQINTSYTLSKSDNFSDDSVATEGISPVSNPFNYAAERGPAITDQRHRFVFSGILDPSRFPPFFGTGWLIAVVSSFSTPLPIDILQASPAPDGVSILRPPGITRNQGNRGSPAQLLNLVNAFRNSEGVPVLTRPLFPQNLNFRDTDVRLSKTLFLGRRDASLTLSVEAYNLFNQTNFISNGGPGGGWMGSGVQNIATSNFVGEARSTPGVLGSGGPRTIQFAARFSF